MEQTNQFQLKKMKSYWNVKSLFIPRRIFSYLTCLCQYSIFADLVIAKSNGFSRQLSSNCCSLLQAGACCRCFPSLTGTVYHGLLSLCPCITSLKFLSCSPCAVPPFELHSGGAVVLIIASLMSWFSNPKFRGINQTRHFMVIFKHLCLSSLHL